MEQNSGCLNCVELKKVLQVEKKKVLQKNRLIALLRELVRSYEAKDLNLTFNDLSRIYESSASEVTILKQRLSLYLNENQELLQLKNETASRNDLLEKKCRDIEDEISHLRFVNKQLGDYYREKEADHDQHKDRLKKLARKLVMYEPRNSEARKILNLHYTPVESDQKPTKSGIKKKVEESLGDIKKDSLSDDLGIAKSKAEVMNLEGLGMSVNNEYDHDKDIAEISSFVYNEECSNSVSIQDIPTGNKENVASEINSDSFMATDTLKNKLNLAKSAKNAQKELNGSTIQHSDDSLNFLASVNDFQNEVSIDTSNIEINKEKEKSFTDDRADHLTMLEEIDESDLNYHNISFRNKVNINYNDLNDSIEFDNRLPDLISPLKSDGPRVLNTLLGCKETNLRCDNDETSEQLDTNKEETDNVNNDKNEKVSADIKNECSSNCSDHVDKNKKSSCPSMSSKYKHLNDNLIFNKKSIDENCLPLTGSFTNSYQLQSPNYLNCCNNTLGSRPPIVLKLYNCSNVEIGIPSSIQKQDIPIITVRDSHNAEKSYFNTSNLVKKRVEPCAFHSSFNSAKLNGQLYQSNNSHLLNVTTCNRQCFLKPTPICQERLKESSNPYYQDEYGRLKNSDYYFLDYLTKNKNRISSNSYRKQTYDENDTIVCNRLFPVKVDKQLDMEQFCYKFQSLTMNCSLPKCNFILKGSSNKKNSFTKGFSSLFSISKPPVFHNTLKNSTLNTNNRNNEKIFGQNFNVCSDRNQQDLCNKLTLNPSKFLNLNGHVNSTRKNSDLLKKPVIVMKVNHSTNVNRNNLSDTTKSNIHGNQFLRQPCLEIDEQNENKATKRPFHSVGFDLKTEESLIPRKVTILERRKMIQSHLDMRSSTENINIDSLRNVSVVKVQNVHTNEKIPIALVEKSESDQVSNLTGCNKSIFDLDLEKYTSSKDPIKTSGHCSIQKQVELQSHSLYQTQKAIAAEINQPSLPERVFPEEKSKSHKTSPLKDKSSSEQTMVEVKQGFSKKLKTLQTVNLKNTSKTNEVISKKQDLKAPSSSFISEKKADCLSPTNTILKTISKEESNSEKSIEVDHSTFIVRNDPSKPSADFVNNPSSNTLKPLSEIKSKEPMILANGKLNRTESTATFLRTPKNYNVSSSTFKDKEEDVYLDCELQEIFKENQSIPPLLSPLRRTPDISCGEEPSSFQEVKGTVNDLVVTDFDVNPPNIILETEHVPKLEDVKKQLIKEPSVVNSVELMQSCQTSCGNIQDKESIDEKPNSVSPTVDLKTYNIFSDEDEINADVETAIVEDVLSADNKIENNVEIETLKNTGHIRSYVRNKNKVSSVDKLNEEEKVKGSNSLIEQQKFQKIDKTSLTVSNNYSDHKIQHDPQIHGEKNKDEINLSDDYKSTFSLGFYVNRSDTECAIISNVSSPSENAKVECFQISSEQNPDILVTGSMEQSSNPTICYTSVRSPSLHEDEQQEEKSSITKEENGLYKRKQLHNDGQIKDMYNKKKQKTSEDNDECVPCENDVFICALKYLSAVALADCSSTLQKSNPETAQTSLTGKIAINHIKNLIFGVLESFGNNSYDEMNNIVKKIKQINEASALTLAKAIIEAVTESNDKEEIRIKTFIPNMTKTVKLCLLIAVSFIGYNRDYVMEFLEVFELYISSFYDKSLTVKEGSQLVVFYTAFCRSYNLDYKVKYLIYDVLYTRNIKAYPMVYRIIQTWPDIVPDSQSCTLKGCLLTQTIIFILLSGTSSIDEKLAPAYCTGNIRTYLQKHFGYKCDVITRNELTDMIIEKISARGGSLALVLLCKCVSWEWASSVVEKKLFPILQSFKSCQMDESTLCEYILTVGRIVRGFPITKAAYIVKNTLELFDDILQESSTTHRSEIVIEAISLLRRHNLMKCTSILMNWCPKTKEVSKKTIDHVKSILRVKNIMHWKHVYTVNSPNVKQIKRTFRSKRKL